MLRSIWRGVIAFGMVSIPVKLFPATGDKDLALHLLHRDCKSRLQHVNWCPVDERQVAWEEIVRGYQYAKELYVVLTDEELERLPVPSKHSISLTAFVKAAEIDPVYYQKSYYLEPDQTGVKPYALLIRALEEKGLVALAKVTLRTRERLCSLRPLGGRLVLDTLFYADEVRLPMSVAPPSVTISQPELSMAYSLMDLLSQPFEPEKYQDEYREALTHLIEAKLAGKETVEQPELPAAKIVDLMAALKASVEAVQKGKESRASGKEGKRIRKAG